MSAHNGLGTSRLSCPFDPHRSPPASAPALPSPTACCHNHSTLVPAAAFLYTTQGVWRFNPRCSELQSCLLCYSPLSRSYFIHRRLYAALSGPCASPMPNSARSTRQQPSLQPTGRSVVLSRLPSLLLLSQPTSAEQRLSYFIHCRLFGALCGPRRGAGPGPDFTSTCPSRSHHTLQVHPYAFVHLHYATLGCRETRAALVTGPSSGRGGG